MEDTGLAQVTMNLLDYKSTPIELVFSKIEEEAASKEMCIRDSYTQIIQIGQNCSLPLQNLVTAIF